MKHKTKLLLMTIAAMITFSCNNKTPLAISDTTGWSIQNVSEGIVWYNYTGFYEPFESYQIADVLQVDLNKYKLKVVHTEEPDSLSAFMDKFNAICGINGSYFEPRASFVKVDNKIYREVEYTPDSVGFWKHEAALFINGKDIAIDYGTNESYTKSSYSTILSGAPMLISDYKGVGTDFTGDLSEIDIKTLEYEDYRRHQGVRHPRVAVALVDKSTLLLVAVSGRWNYSKGMTADELTRFLRKYFNPQYALNIDGGGSTTMCIDGYGEYSTGVVNMPTDNKKFDHFGQRKVNNVLLITK